MANLKSLRQVREGPFQTQSQRSPLSSLAYGCTCLPVIIAAALLGILTAVYFFSPGYTNIAILGVDFTGVGSSTGRSDTNILVTVRPGEGTVGMLSVPRDLWVSIPGYGENRINAAHFLAEASEPGSGPTKVKETIESNFGVTMHRYLRINFEGFKDMIDAIGGLHITLTEPMAGYEPGSYLLSGKKALAFARNRTGTDDFYRMEQGQLIIEGALKQMISPLNWIHLPAVLATLPSAVDTDIPFWLWPRLGLVFLRTGPEHIAFSTITRDMVTPTTTAQGASVLLPNWDRINPALAQIFLP